MAENIVDWAKFGAVYAGIVSILIVLAAALVGGAIGGGDIGVLIGLIGIPIVIIAVVAGAVGWAINSFIYGFVKKHIQKQSVTVQVGILGILQTVMLNAFQAQALLSIETAISAFAGAVMVVFVAKRIGLKVPVTQRKR